VKRRGAILAAALAIADLAGCSALTRQADTTKYFVLTPVAVPEPASAVGFDRAVGVGPVTIPDHLDNYLVTRLSAEEIDISDTDRWSEPLREAVSSVLRQNLVALLGTERVVIYPWDPSTPPDLAVKMEVRRFERTTYGTAEITARWSIERGSDRTPLLTEETSISEPIRGTDTRAAVSGLSVALSQLSRQIAGDVRRASLARASQSLGHR
jgi:uncharacterized lipoprotein YmbA